MLSHLEPLRFWGSGGCLKGFAFLVGSIVFVNGFLGLGGNVIIPSLH
jgi:hypothetical protein